MTYESGGRYPFQRVARVGRVSVLVLACAIPPFPTLAQQHDTTVSAGEQYGAGGLHGFFFGRHYRDLWTTPITVEVLNLQTHGSGLTPTTAGGGRFTRSLRFRGNNGLQYGFRSVDKDPDILPPALAGTIVQRLVQDQISSAHPAGLAVAAPLMEAIGILHTNPRLVILPDDPALGQFRERFAGTLGFIEERTITDHAAPFAGAAEIIDGNEIFERTRRSSRDRVDARAFLNARLFDLVIGDRDRHRGQWRWARFGDQPVTRWVPIPEDRDQAFIRYDGLVMALARITVPQMINFGNEYPNIVGVTWNAQEVDRQFLSELEKPVWDSVATVLQARLTDAVIESAVAAMPPEYYAIDGARLTEALKLRRDMLPEAADRFYRLLAQEVDVHGNDEAEIVTVDRHSDGAVEVVLADDTPQGNPHFRRRFDPRETSEIRLYLHGGDDRVLVRGGGSGRIMVRFIGDAGNDEIVDSSRVGGVRFYSSDGDRTGGPTGVRVDRRPYAPPPRALINLPPARDWGHLWRPVGWAAFGPDVGLFIGGGVYHMRFGFRHHPFASRIRVRVGYSAGASTGRLGLLAQFRRSNSRARFEIDARASGIEVLRFHGFGNEVVLAQFDNSEFYRVNQNQFAFEPSVVLPLGSSADLAFGPSVRYTTTDSIAGRFLATLFPLYGTDDFGQVGAMASLQVDTRDVPAAATRGIWFTVGGRVYPKVWDVDSTTFGEVHGEVATYLTAGPATLALRAGGKKVWGTFPYFEAAFIGDARTVRLGRRNRFAGDAAAFGNAELRLDVAPIFLVLPGRFGIFGIGDIGRVWLDGESSDLWHPAVGGGIWLSFLTRAYTASIAVTRSEVGTSIPQRTGIYAQAGFAF